MSASMWEELREQGRALVGAFTVVGVTFIYTMETWWHGWQLPVTTLLIYDLVGLALVLGVTRVVGFREGEVGGGERGGGGGSGFGRLRGKYWFVADFAELILQGFIAGYLAMLLFGIVSLGSPVSEIVRLGLILIVPLSFGAALANRLFEGAGGESEFAFPKNLAIFAIGAIFVASTIAPTQEVELMAARTGWWREALIVLVSVLTAYFILYELELQGENQSTPGRGTFSLLATAAMVYGTALAVTVLLLAAFGHFSNAPYIVWVQEMIVLGFPATIGASAAQVVI